MQSRWVLGFFQGGTRPGIAKEDSVAQRHAWESLRSDFRGSPRLQVWHQFCRKHGRHCFTRSAQKSRNFGSIRKYWNGLALRWGDCDSVSVNLKLFTKLPCNATQTRIRQESRRRGRSSRNCSSRMSGFKKTCKTPKHLQKRDIKFRPCEWDGTGICTWIDRRVVQVFKGISFQDI